MLLRPEGPYIVARLPVQPQKYCALRARQYSMPWWGPYWLDRNWIVQARLHAKMAFSRASRAV